MTWRRPLRIGLAVAGLGFAVALVVMRRDREAPPPPPAVSADPAASTESSGGRFEHSHDGVLEFTIDHSGQRTYPDGRSTFVSVHIRFAGTGREIWADELEMRGQGASASSLGRVDLRGSVRLVQGDALTVEVEAATFDDTTGTLDIPGAVRFTKGRLTGRGVGAVYEREADLLRILADASAAVAGTDDPADAVSFSASRMSLASGQNYLHLEEQARIVRATETLTGDHATLTLGAELGHIRYLELRGRAEVAPGDQTSAVPAMKANDITLAFHEDARTLEHATLTGQASLRLREAGGERSVEASWIDLHLAPDGRTVTRLDGRDRVAVRLPATRDAPAREIHSTTLVARGTPAGGLETARFEGQASFVERPVGRGGAPPPVRSAEAGTLTLALDGGLDAITEAVFQEAVTFTSGAMTAEADRARYQAGAGRLVLERGEAVRGRQPRLRREDGTFTVDADLIDVDIESEDLTAAGQVTTVSRTHAASDRQSGLFEAGKPVYGSGTELDWSESTGVATYRGDADRPARLTQGDNRVAAGTVVIEEATNNLRADGRVETAFVEVPVDAAAEPRVSEVTAAHLVYDDAARTATYRGEVVLRSPDGETHAELLVLTLTESRAVASFDATGPSVYASLSGGHEARGERLRFDGAARTYTLLGKPAQAKSPNDSGDGCLLTIGPQVTLRPGRSARWEGAGVVEIRRVPCEAPIR